MEANHAQLERMCKQFLDSLLNNDTRHTLCLNIAEPDFAAEKFVIDELQQRDRSTTLHEEPTPTQFASILESLDEAIAVVNFEDLDKKPRCMDLLLEHVKNPSTAGKLVVVSRFWNSDNTAKEIDLRKHCLFYQQNLPRTPRRH